MVDTFEEKIDGLIDQLFVAAGTVDLYQWKLKHQYLGVFSHNEQEILERLEIEYEKDSSSFSYDLIFDLLLSLAELNNVMDIVEELFQEVYNSNMSKLDENGNPIINGENGIWIETEPKGKVLKISPNFFEPDLKSILHKYNKAA